MKTALGLIALVLVACTGPESVGDAGAFDLASTPTDGSPQTDLSGPAPTYANFAKGFFTAYCVRCHPATGQSARDFTQYAVISTNSHNIACGVSPTALAGCSGNPAPGQFPIGSGPFPSDAERNELVAWIQAGLTQ